MRKISILIDEELYNGVVLKLGKTSGAMEYIENTIRESLEDHTLSDFDKEKRNSIAETITSKGFLWKSIWLPERTQVMMKYQGREYTANVNNRHIYYGGRNFSPSEWVSYIAGGTNRNAWRDIWIKRPQDADWARANDLRKQEEKKTNNTPLTGFVSHS
jgi:hypothetical protein